MNALQKHLHSHRALWDKLGIIISSICILHCIALPLAFFFFPIIKEQFFPEEDATHMILLAFILGFAGLAFVSGFRVHGEKKPVILMIIGMVFMIFATYFAHDYMGHYWEPIIALIGSLFLIRAHMLNHRHCNVCKDHDH